MAKGEDLVHLKFEYEEVLDSKRDILLVEKSLIRMMKSLMSYHDLRNEELKKREAFNLKTKQTISSLKNLQKNLPKVEVPEILKPEEKEAENVKKQVRQKIQKTKAKTKEEKSIEHQLMEIQEKLKSIGS